MPDREQGRLRRHRHPVLPQLGCHRVRGVGELVGEPGVGRGDRSSVVGRHGGVPHQHPRRAQGTVERVDQLGHPAYAGPVPDPERGAGDHGEPLVGGELELTDQVVGRAGVGQQVERRLHLTVDHDLARGPQQGRDLVEHQGGLLTGSPQRCRRDDGGGDQCHRSADERVAPPADSLPRVRQQRRHHDRLHRCLGDEELAAVQQERGGHGQRDDQGQLPPATAGRRHDEVGDEDPDRDAEGHLGHPPQPLPVRRAEAHHRRDRREEGGRVAEHVGGDEPRDAGGERALADLPELRAGPVDARRHRRPTAGPEAIEGRSRGHGVILS